MQSVLQVSTSGPGLYEFTDRLAPLIGGAGFAMALLTLFVQHTSCSLLIQENADPDVRADLDEFFRRLVPPSDAPGMDWVRHTTEGPDDMPSHIKAALLPVSLSIPILGGRLGLGQWQGVYLFEHRDRPQVRRVVAQING